MSGNVASVGRPGGVAFLAVTAGACLAVGCATAAATRPAQVSGPGGPAAPAATVSAAHRDPAEATEPEEERELPEFSHRRLETSRGPIHLWRPPGFDFATAGVVLYVHGYFVDADAAWRQHRLADQFRRSGRNALFVVPEAPSSAAQPVVWPNIDDLLRAVEEELRHPLPGGPLVAAGHSGAFRTILEWLHSGQVDQVVLLDGLYGGQERFLAWLRSDEEGPSPRMVMVASTTLAETRRLAEAAPAHETLPLRALALAPEGIDVPVLVVTSRSSHMALVTEGRAIPRALRLTALPAL